MEPYLLLHEVEKDHILKVMALKNQNKTHAAKALGIGIRTLQRKLKQYLKETQGDVNE
jgi:DNA-binding protein Fis